MRGRFPADLSKLVELPKERLLAPTESAEVMRERWQQQQEGRRRREPHVPPEEEGGSINRTACVKNEDGGGGGGEGGDGEDVGTGGKRRERIEAQRAAKKIRHASEMTQTHPAVSAENAPHAPMTYSDKAGEDVGYGHDEETGGLVVRCPIGVVSHKEGIHACDPSGKAALSSFR